MKNNAKLKSTQILLLSCAFLSSCVAHNSVTAGSEPSVNPTPVVPGSSPITSASDTSFIAPIPEEENLKEPEESLDPSSCVTLTGDFDNIVDPPLLKKVAMYNAGCIDPLSNYDRDFQRARELNADSLRVDLSIGKENGTGGQYLVGEDYDYEVVPNQPEYYDLDTGPWTWGNPGWCSYKTRYVDKYKVDKDSLEYNFDQLDGLLDTLQENDVLPYMSWDYIPFPLEANGRWNDLDQNIINWQEVWEEIYYNYALHYVENGIQLGYQEIYNEPDLEYLINWNVFPKDFDGFLKLDDFCGYATFEDGTPNCNGYAGGGYGPAFGVYPDMYQYGVQGILRADPDATVGGPAFALGECAAGNDGGKVAGYQGDGNGDGVDWMGVLGQIQKRNVPMDFFSFHTYLDGETWYRPQAKRNENPSDSSNEIERVVHRMGSDPYWIKTAVHINEFSPLNDSNGATLGEASPWNYFQGASLALDGLTQIVDRPTVQWVNWAQMMDSTGGDAYGLINADGHIKAPFNALKIYADMPVWRYEADFDEEDTGLHAMLSSDDGKIGLLIWNDNQAYDEDGNLVEDGDEEVNVVLNDAPFTTGTRRVYRIDSEHGSYYDDEDREELIASNIREDDFADSLWTGTVPAQGVVYITLSEDPSARDFDNYEEKAVDLDGAVAYKTQYYYEDRYRGMRGAHEDYGEKAHGSYSHFDRKSWTMYLGEGDCLGNANGNYVDQAEANGAVLVKNMPWEFTCHLKTEGNPTSLNDNSALMMRLDFRDDATRTYDSSDSYVFENGIYNPDRNPNLQDGTLAKLPSYPWGSQKQVDELNVVEFAEDDYDWNIDLHDVAPEWWDPSKDSVMVSFEMRNTCPNTRAIFQLTPND